MEVRLDELLNKLKEINEDLDEIEEAVKCGDVGKINVINSIFRKNR